MRTLYTRVFKARLDVNCVILVHPFWCTVLSLLENQILGLPVFFSGRRQVESLEDGEAIRRALGDSFGLLIPCHGVVVAHDILEQTLVSTVYLESQTKKLYHASVMGKIAKAYLDLNIKPPRATIDGDYVLWF